MRMQPDRTLFPAFRCLLCSNGKAYSVHTRPHNPFSQARIRSLATTRKSDVTVGPDKGVEPLSPPSTSRKWSNKDLAVLSEAVNRAEVANTSPDWPDLAKTLGRTVSAIQQQSYNVGKERTARPWSFEDLKTLKEALAASQDGNSKFDRQGLAKQLDRSLESIDAKRNEIGRECVQGGFSHAEDEFILKWVGKYEAAGRRPPWTKIAVKLNRPPEAVQERYSCALNPANRTGLWTQAEDALLTERVAKAKSAGESPNWKAIGDLLRRSRKAVAARWRSVLDPTLVKGPWTEEETLFLRDAALKSIAEGERPKYAEIGKALRRTSQSVSTRWEIVRFR